MKKIIALLLSLLLLCGTLPTFAAVQVYDAGSTDVEAAETLLGLGLISSATEEESEKGVLTRGEMASILLKLMGQNCDDGSYEGIFSDVTETHTYRREIEYAYRMGLLNGKETGVFAPEAPVTYEELATMLVKALGLSNLAEAGGGYPNGYLNVAQRMGVLDGVHAASGDILRCRAGWRMIFNTLQADSFQVDTVTGDVVSGALSDETLLSSSMQIGHYRGVVEANDISYLSGVDGLASGMVLINGVQYNEGTSGASAFLGYYIDYYVDLSVAAAPQTIIYARINRQNTVLSVDAADLMPYDAAYGKYMLVYDNNGRKTQKISEYADFLYNGVWQKYSASDLKPSNGTVTLIDNNNDGKADVISIVSYKTIVVKSASKDSQTVFDRYDGTAVSLDGKNGENKVTILRGGKVEKFTAIKEWSVLSVAESGNTTGGKSVTVLHSRDSVSGMLESKDDRYATIDDTVYEMTPEFKTRLSGTSAGTSGKWYLDAFGKLAALDEADGYSSSMDYAYIIALSAGRGLDARAQLKLLQTGGAIGVFDVAEKVSIDGGRATSVTGSALEALLLNTGSGTVQQLIRCGMNQENKITRIDTIESGSGGANDSLSRDYKPDPTASNKPRYSQYAWGFGIEKQEIMIDGNTTIFRVPTGSETEEKYFGTGSLSSFAHQGTYDIEGYDLSATKVCGALVYKQEPRPQLVSAPTTAFVESVGTGLSSEGEIKTSLQLWYNGQPGSYLLENDDLLDDENYVPGKRIESGDVIIFSTNTEGEITAIQKFFNAKAEEYGYVDYENDDFNTNDWWFYANLRLMVGRLVAKDEGSLLLSYGTDINDVAKQVPGRIHSTMRAYVYSVKRSKMQAISTAELENYTSDKKPTAKVVAALAGGRPVDIFVIDYE